MTSSSNRVDDYIPRLRENDMTLVELSLSNSKGVGRLSAVLATNSTLVTLNLTNSKISPKGAKRLSTALTTNSKLMILNLYKNRIGPESGRHLAAALAANTTLTTLHLEDNNISDDGAARMVKSLAANTVLTSLNLALNDISGLGARRLSPALATNIALRALILGGNNIGDEGAGHLATALVTNSSLTLLSLNKNRITDKGFGDLAMALTHNAALTELNLRDNNYLTDDGASRMAKALASKNATLKCLHLNSPKISAPLLTQLARLVETASARQIRAKRLRLRPEVRLEIEAPFTAILDEYNVSAASRDFLFEVKGLTLDTLKYLTIQDLCDSVKDNHPVLPELQVRALFKSLESMPSSSIDPFPSNPTSRRFSSPPQLIPRSELKYPIGTPLGAGAFGKVFVGEHQEVRVAIKQMKTRDAGAMADFIKEASVMTTLRSPLLVKLIGICLDPQLMVLELMGGGSLFDLLHKPKEHDPGLLLPPSFAELPWQKKIDILCEMARGIEFLHQLSVAHRDLKPANILLSADHREVKLADFGFSRKVDTSSGLLETFVRGTPFYMAPELLLSPSPSSSSASPVSKKSTPTLSGLFCDIYAFGIIMWEVAFRMIPYSGMDLTYLQLSSRVVYEHLRPPIYDHEELSDDFASLMIRCWDHDSSRRPKIEEILALLLHWQAHPGQPTPHRTLHPHLPKHLQHHDHQSADGIIKSKSKPPNPRSFSEEIYLHSSQMTYHPPIQN